MLDVFLKQSRKTVIFTGAGVSTDSGLMDFRSADKGMWNNREMLELASIEAMEEYPQEFVGFYTWRVEEMRKHDPNETHHILAKWEREGLIEGIITQNVENYHELAGSQKIAKLHGDLGTIRCVRCESYFSSDYYLSSEGGSECPNCGGLLRPNVVLFGEMMPEEPFELARQWMTEVELLIVLGSSLHVSPANTFPKLAKQQGSRLVIINRDVTPLDDIADMVVRHSIREVLQQTAEAMERGR